MAKPRNNKIIPANSIVGKRFEKPHYQDIFSIELNNAPSISVDQLFYKVLAYNPQWVKLLMKLRDFLVQFAGLKRTDQVNTVPPKAAYYETGMQTGLFRILDRTSNEIVFYENDKHLNFQSSLFLDTEANKSTLYSITLVHYNNFTGRLYFFFVKPFHRFIIKMMLKQLAKTS